MMAKTYRPKRRRRVRGLRIAAAAGLIWIGVAGVAAAAGPDSHPAPPAVTVQQAPPADTQQAAAPAPAQAAGGHSVLGGLMAAHALLPHGGGGRPFWRIRRARRWYR